MSANRRGAYVASRRVRRPGGRGLPRLAGLLAVLTLACGGPDAGTADAAMDGPAAAESGAEAQRSMAAGEWQVLFDGTSLDQWRGYGRANVPPAWRIEDGALTFVPGSRGGDLITKQQYGDFELELEWRIAPRGNSGIFYRAPETDSSIWHAAPEMQILDDAGHPDGGSSLTSAGSNYALHAPSARVVKPAGEWNQVRIVAHGDHVEHWLNGTKVVEYELGSEDWKRLVAASKFAAYPEYGMAERGHIGLQDHGDRVWFRTIRIREISSDTEHHHGSS